MLCLYFIGEAIASMNPYIKNCRTGFHDDILNRTAHYLKLLTTKSTIANSHPQNYLALLAPNNKAQEQARQAANLLLANSLISIDRKSSPYHPQSHLAQRRLSMRSQYQERQREISLSRDNLRLYKKLTAVESEISCDKIRKFDEEVSRYSKLIRHPVKEVKEMDDRLFDTYRHQLIRGKLSPGKYRAMMEDVQQKGNKPCLKNRKKHRLRKIERHRTEHSPIDIQ